MRAALCLALSGIPLYLLTGCNSTLPSEEASGSKSTPTSVNILIDVKNPSKSSGILTSSSQNRAFAVGYGKYGIACAKSTFTEGVTPLGTFRVNAILSENQFEMEPGLISQSGKSKSYLEENLFKNMSAIDFKGDGETNEYGEGYISLAPVDSTPQPFEFNEYSGKLRWYSFAIHGTNDENRVGKKITGGCLNVASEDLNVLLETVQLGDIVEITANGPCQT